MGNYVQQKWKCAMKFDRDWVSIVSKYFVSYKNYENITFPLSDSIKDNFSILVVWKHQITTLNVLKLQCFNEMDIIINEDAVPSNNGILTWRHLDDR